MEPLICNVMTNLQGQELQKHGSPQFPAACYDDQLSGRDQISVHWHAEMEIVLVVSGRAVVSVNGVDFEAEENTAFFINAEMLHGVRSPGNTSCHLHAVVFHPRLVGGSTDSIFWQQYLQPLLSAENAGFLAFQRDSELGVHMRRCIERIWQDWNAEPPGYTFRIREALSQIIFCISQALPMQSVVLPVRSRRDAERIKVMLQFIRENYGEVLTVAQIAQSAAVSKSECMRCFRNTIGMSPMQYVKRFRVQQASELLLSSRRCISDIGAQCGFQEMSYFAKAFREHQGCTPRAYREKHLKTHNE